MFRVVDNVPEIYPHQSRDFQLISRLYDLVFQETRQSIDSLKYITDTKKCDATILPLLGTKLGLFESLQLPDSTYRYVLSAFPQIIKYKGSPHAIQLIVNLFEKLVNTEIDVELEQNRAVIRFLKYSPSSDLLSTLLEYVRPTGFTIDWAVYDVADTSTMRFDQTDSYKVSAMNEGDASLVAVTHTNNSQASNVGFVQILQTKKQETPINT